MTVRAVLFDMDGVLVDSYDAWFHLLQVTHRDLGGNEVTPEAFAASWGQGVDADVASFFVGSTVAEVSAHYASHFADHAHHVVANRDAAAVFAALADRGAPTAVVTNTPVALAEATLAAVGIAANAVVGAQEGLAPKPAPDMVQSACARLGVRSTEALMVGDSRYDRGAAQAAGVRFVGFGGIAGDDTVATLTEVLDLLE